MGLWNWNSVKVKKKEELLEMFPNLMKLAAMVGFLLPMPTVNYKRVVYKSSSFTSIFNVIQSQ